MSRLERQFAEYAEHHETLGNRVTHSIGIPAIALALTGLCSKLEVGTPSGWSFDLGLVLAIVLVSVFLSYDVRLAIGCGVILFSFYFAGRMMVVPTLVALLVVGVGLQYVGHYVFERKAPAFHDNFVHTIIGPLYLLALLYEKLGLRESERPSNETEEDDG